MIRPLAALLACVVGVLAILTLGPDDDKVGLHAVADLGSTATGSPIEVTAPTVTTRDGSASRGLGSRDPGSRGLPLPAVDDSAALAVEIENMSPTVVPRNGPVIVRGSVTNRSEVTWTDINVYACTSSFPMTTGAEVRAAAEADPELQVCERTNVFVSIDELAPGERGRYRIRVPRTELGIPNQAGVYWFNIQVLGTSPEGRPTGSVGRARSFLPLVDANPEVVPTTVVLPVRRPVLRDAEGRLSDLADWADVLSAGGRLDNLLTFAEGAGPSDVALLVDPAVVQAVQQLSEGNPSRRLDAPVTPGDGDEQSEGQAPTEDLDDDVDAATRARARTWLARFVAVAARQRVLALPFGDVDLAAAARYEPGLYDLAREQSELFLDSLEVPSAPALVPPSGLLSDAGLALAGDGAPAVLLSTAAVPGSAEADPALVPETFTAGGVTASTYDEALATGGPGPNDPLAPVALRQRILAEAAIRSLTGDERRLLVTLPASFDPGPGGDRFFTGLDRPFVGLQTVLPTADETTPELAGLDYPQRQLERELPAAQLTSTQRLIDLGGVLDRLLPETDTVALDVLREALATASYQVREDTFTASIAAQRSASWIAQRLASVTISAPEFVILASEEGPFAVTLENGLDQPVELRIRARTDGDLVIKAPQTIELEAGTSRTLTLSARAETIGVHPVTLVTTDSAGTPLGTSEDISIRSNQVGRIIWVIMGAGVGILFLAIAVRLVRRFRRSRAA